MKVQALTILKTARLFVTLDQLSGPGLGQGLILSAVNSTFNMRSETHEVPKDRGPLVQAVT